MSAARMTLGVGSAPVATRSTLRAVALPTEHGGWGLTLEPVLLGLLVAPGPAGFFLGCAALVGFLARTPLKVVLVDAHRHRDLERTHVARRVVGGELGMLTALVAAAVATADGTFWIPALVALPLVGVELWFDMRSRSRRLLPELGGAVGIGAVAAMIVLAGGEGGTLAAGVWMILAARAVTSIPSVRDQVARLHPRPTSPVSLVIADAAALLVAAGAAIVDTELIAGAVAIAVVVAAQRLAALRPASRATVLGLRQMVLGLVVVLVTAVGVLAS
jgi:YwiC-like protein